MRTMKLIGKALLFAAVMSGNVFAMEDDIKEGPSEYFLAISFSTRKKDNYTLRHNKARQIIKEVLDA